MTIAKSMFKSTLIAMKLRGKLRYKAQIINLIIPSGPDNGKTYKINSRHLVSILIILGASVALLTMLVQCNSKEKAEAKVERPNVIFIMSDDHTSQAVSAYGGMISNVCPTPNIDRLANEGMLFNNLFVTNSICTPSRSAIFTGKYAHKNGVYKFTALDQAQPTLPKAMQQAGYHTALLGKYHLHSNPVGLDFFSVLPGQGRYHNPEFIEMGDTHPSGWVQQG